MHHDRPALALQRDAVIALCGAPMALSVDGVALPFWQNPHRQSWQRAWRSAR
jgi:allophanate hydrolase subunit 2